jgi:hypothetical protein
MNTNTLQPEYAEIAEVFLLAWDNGDYDFIPTETFILELVEKCQAAALKRDAEIAALKAKARAGVALWETVGIKIRQDNFTILRGEERVDLMQAFAEFDAAMQSVTDSQTESKTSPK